MTATSLVSAGQNITYTIKVTNQGPSSVASAYLYNLEIPAGTTFVSTAATQGTLNTPAVGSKAGLITGKLGALSKGGAATVTLVVRVSSPTSLKAILGGAGVSANLFDPVVLNNVAATTTKIK